jgi:uncharacterized membrane protein
MHVTLMVTGALFGGLFGLSGIRHVLGHKRWCTPVEAMGFSATGTRAVGVCELAGGAGLLAGWWLPWVGTAAAAGLFLVTACALQYHHWHLDRLRRYAPAAFTSLVMLTYVSVQVLL